MFDQGAFRLIQDQYCTRPSRRERQESRDSSGAASRGSSVREINDHIDEFEAADRRRVKIGPDGKKFLKKVQHELEEQRQEWKDEVDRLTNGATAPRLPKNAHLEGSNSFVDTSSGVAVFTTFIDVREFHPRSLEVDYDPLCNKLIVRGRSMNGSGTMTKTLTQKIQLPRYADDQRLTSKLNERGILKVEVPLLYYFPEQQKRGRDVKSFVNEVRTGKDGRQTLEILVNTGPGVRATDLHVQVTDDRVLLITADKMTDNGHSTRKLIKKYTLPPTANLDGIRSRMGRDGRLMVLIPLNRHS